MAQADPVSQTISDQELLLLRKLVPLHTLPDEAFASLCSEVRIDSYAKGRALFAQGDTDHVSFYLLSGEVALLSGDHEVDRVEAGSEQARFPIGHVLPRKQGARALKKSRVARFDSRRVSDLLARAHTQDYQVADVGEGEPGDWMSLMLQSPILQQVPASNIQRVMMNVDQVDVSRGEAIIRQGDPGDFYYMLVKGQAQVLREGDDGQPPIELARLAPGNAFGEEALLSDNPRNSTIRMLTDGEVLRLAKSDFVDLIQVPISSKINFDEAQKRVEQGAVWLDLRAPEVYEKDHLPGSINLPIESLRYQVASLAPDRHYVLYSNTGGRSDVAAFLLIERGFDVSILAGGLRAAKPEKAGSVAPVPASTSTPAPTGDPSVDAELQQRAAQAEQRARELEQRLKRAKEIAEAAEQERQQHAEAAEQSVDKARRQLAHTLKEKEAALQAQKQAYHDMEELTSSLEKLQSERSQLSDRMLEIEGLDKKLQQRLKKAERELIGERERAEAADQHLEQVTTRLDEVLKERNNDRDLHAQQLGELKEQVTVLQMDLELAKSELQEAQAARSALDTSNQQLQELSQALEQQRQEAERQAVLVSQLQEEAREYADLLAQRDKRIKEQQSELQDVQAVNTQLAEQIEQLQQQADTRAEDASGMAADRAQDKARLHKLQQELQAANGALVQAQQEVARSQENWQQQRGELEENLSDVNAQVLALQEQLEATQAARTEQQSAAETQVVELQQQLQEGAEQLAELEQKLRSLETAENEQVQDLRDQVLQLEQEVQAGDSLRADLDAERERTGQAEAKAEALQSELHEQAEQIQVLSRQRDELGEALEKAQILSDEIETLRGDQEQFADMPAQLAQRDTEIETLQSQLQESQQEVAQLRSVMETYVEQIKEIQTGEDQQQALRTELEMVREQAVKDVAQMREKLSAADNELRGLRSQGGQEAISIEAMRQELSGVRASLEERQRELQLAEEARQLSEDEVEDINKSLEDARRERDRLAVELEENQFRVEEAELARKQVQEELLRYQQQAEVEKVADLRDERMRPSSRPLDMDAVAGGGVLGKMLPLVLGAALTVAALEALSFMAGRGELISSLLK